MTIIKNIETEQGTVITSAEVTHSDNGQAVIHITSKLGDVTHEHRVTIGAENGIDSVAQVRHCPTCGAVTEQTSISAMSEADLQTTIQKHLNQKRNEAAQVLAGRAKVAKITANLK